MVAFCRAPLDARGQPVVGKLEGGEPSTENWLFLRCSVDTAELFICCRLAFYVCFVGVVPPPNPLEQISASPSELCVASITLSVCVAQCAEKGSGSLL